MDNQKQIEKIKKINRELEQYTSLISHDLQQPLVTIANYLKRVQKRFGHTLEEEPSHMINVAIDETDRLLTMTQDLLFYSKLGKNGIKLKVHKCGDIVEHALMQLSTDIQDKKASITYDNLPKLKCNKSLMIQLFQNLLSNAIKYCDKNQPRIHISAKKGQQEWIFTVSDNGKGIKPSHLPMIFDIFHRSDNAKVEPGSGIGLALCKKVATLHNGAIWVKSQYKKGSTFYFTIPDK